MLDPLNSLPADVYTPLTPSLIRSMSSTARAGLGAFVTSHLSVLRLEGSDRARWLHGQCTQEIKGLAVGQAAEAFVLDAKGRNLGDITIAVFPDHILVLCPRSASPTLVAHWKRFIIAEDVVVQDQTDSSSTVYLTGLGLSSFLQSFAHVHMESAATTFAAEVKVAGETLTLISDAGSGTPAVHVIGPSIAVEAWDKLGKALLAGKAAHLPNEIEECLRIAAFKPRFGIDFDGTVLPKESGEEARRVSYTKGCYTGQEVVARQHFLGEPRRMLRSASWRGGPVAPGTQLVRSDGTRVGRLTSCSYAEEVGRCVGIAMIDGPAKLELELLLVAQDLDDEPVTLTIGAPKYLKA